MHYQINGRERRQALAPTLAAVWLSPCCGAPAYLIMRGDVPNPVRWSGVPCSMCKLEYSVVIDVLRESERFKQIQDVEPQRDQLLCWALP